MLSGAVSLLLVIFKRALPPSNFEQTLKRTVIASMCTLFRVRIVVPRFHLE